MNRKQPAQSARIAIGRWPVHVLALVVAAACGGGSSDGGRGVASATPSGAATDSGPPSVRYEQHVFAGGVAPPAGKLTNPFRGDARSAKEGEQLFKTMNCDGCHGGDATGWVGPSLSDGRWRYGGADGVVFQSIYYGRAEGMPAYGGVLTPPLAWKIVTYLNSLTPPKAVPTQSW
jgi:cytochrome c oxidase cbb3-type subunit 3